MLTLGVTKEGHMARVGEGSKIVTSFGRNMLATEATLTVNHLEKFVAELFIVSAWRHQLGEQAKSTPLLC